MTFPQLVSPAHSQIPLSCNSTTNDSTILSIGSPSSTISNDPPEQPPDRPLGKLEDMKVSDLKMELKRRSLPVSGAKPQLIERLKPFMESLNCNIMTDLNVTNVGHQILDGPILISKNESNSDKNPTLLKNQSMNKPRISSPCNNDQDKLSNLSGNQMLKEHYHKKVEELQREIIKMRSHQQLQQFQQNQSPHTENKLMLQQHLQNKMQQQNLTRQLQRYQFLQQQVQLQQQQEKQSTFQQLKENASLATIIHTNTNNGTATAILDSTTFTSINNQKNQMKRSGATTLQMPAAIVLNLAKPAKINGSILSALVAQVQNQQQQQIIFSRERMQTSSSECTDATKALKVKIEPLRKAPVKSQMVDDVLEILIKSGELPASAAQEPLTPTTPNMRITAGLVLNDSTDTQTHPKIILASATSAKEVLPSETTGQASQSRSSSSQSLNLATFSEQLPLLIQQHKQKRTEQDLQKCETNLGKEMLLNSTVVHENSLDPQPPQEVTSSDNANTNLKELGLDLSTMYHLDMECDDIDDVPMDMDDSDWLESFVTAPNGPASLVSSSSKSPPPPPPPSSPLTTTATKIRSTELLSAATMTMTMTAPFLVVNNTVNRFSPTQSVESSVKQNSSTNVSNINNEFDDPLLANSQDPFDLYGIVDSDFKISYDFPSSWDSSQVDFAT
ncbi:probable E3 ubiquitin-protein ligase bre1 [Copidosoma floridanum]|uniref:probable E3 ubiquitin-protein ligase bre1 n=1 Tax=Copidosoma floridanum TaxID=29053 RepID=UPI0006C956A4|nr:probable E3 ubiquitin-protein ligase bre1 [Copidosoma floridanum]